MFDTMLRKFSLAVLSSACCAVLVAEEPMFKVIAFHTSRNDLAHISWVKEANRRFPEMGAKHGFSYEATTNWNRLTLESLKEYGVVLFLDTRPDGAEQRKAFETYMEQGGAWMGFHFAAFTLTPSDFPQNWDWYHNTFIGAGEYVSNTWRPTSAVLRVEAAGHPVVEGLPATFKTAPNEWYRWSRDLRANKDIRVLLSIDPSSFPLGTGPKKHEIWHQGDYPVVWTNQKYRMIYLNMGHNDIDYEHKTNKELSSSFSSEDQNKLVLNSLLWLAKNPGTKTK
jgi:hypothetical protein